MKHLLDFDDAGASDDEPVKGVTMGDIRAWHDQYDNLLSSWADARDRFFEENKTVDRVWDALGISSFEEACGKTVWELVSELKRDLKNERAITAKDGDLIGWQPNIDVVTGRRNDS